MGRLAMGAVMLAALAGGGPIAAAAESAAVPVKPAASLELQCVADQQTAVPGGMSSYHVLVHNSGTAAIDQAWVNIRLKGSLEVPGMDGVVWDEASGTLKFPVKELKTGDSYVDWFNLKVLDSAHLGDKAVIGCSFEANGKEAVAAPDVTVELATEIDQPFFNGYPDGLFHPERSITRAETAAIVARIQELSDKSAADYADVPQDHWAYGYIAKVTKAGYMVGDGDGRFRPDDPISRSEFVTLVLRMRGITPLPLAGVDDVAGHWSKDAVGTANALGYIRDLTDGGKSFLPDQPIERRSAAKLMDIGLKRGQLTDGEAKVVQHWPDVPKDDLFFGWIEEASMTAHESRQIGNGTEELIRYLPDRTNPM